MPDAQTSRADASSEDVLRAFRRQSAELEAVQKQLLAFRLESSVRAAYVAELQQSAEEALSRAERAEHQLRLLRIAQTHDAKPEATGSSPGEGHACPDPLPLVSAAISALQN